MIRSKALVKFQPKSPLRNKIKDTYIHLFNEFHRANPSGKYPRKKLNQNISNVVSVGRISIELAELKQPVFLLWKENNWSVIYWSHWYFAVVLKKTKNGTIIAEIQDCLYEGDYHNDTMRTKPYDEGLIRANKKLFFEIFERIMYPQGK